MKKLHSYVLLLVALSMAMWTPLTSSVQAGFIGDVPIPPFNKDSTDPTLLVGIGIENLWLNKGLVKLGENDKAITIASAKFIDPKDGSTVTDVDPGLGGITPDVKAELMKGAYVKVLPLLLQVPSKAGEKIRPYLRDDVLLLYEVTVHLVLVYGMEEQRIMDTGIVLVEVNPPLVPEV